VATAGLLVLLAAGAHAVEDDFVAGYATAIVTRELGLRDARVRVADGVVTVEVEALTAAERDSLVAALERVEGVRRVDVVAPTAAEGAEATRPADARPGIVVLPRRSLFRPLIADPRWPHFSASWQHWFDGPGFDEVGAANFGETIPLVEGDAPLDGRWQLGVQAGVFSVFDLEAPSLDLINADYVVAAAGEYRTGRVSGLLRLLHQSSHLGDEFLLRNPDVDRINLSYERLDALISVDAHPSVRLYGGGGVLVHREPAIDRFAVQGGVELRSPRRFASDLLRPVAMIDVGSREWTGWTPDVSLRTGLQLESPTILNRHLLLLAEYYDGASPNGQFFDQDIEYLGLGIHLFQ
jgi:hypothetical protein